MRKYKYISFALIISSMVGACFHHGFQPLQLERHDNESSLLLTKGFYYAPTDSNYYDGDSSFHYMVLYNNGVMLGPMIGSNGINGIKNNFENSFYLNQIKKLRTYWGVYQIRDSTLIMESWYAGSLNYYRIRRTAKIIDSVTIEFENIPWKRYMHFRPYNIKPDSTNIFID